MCDVINGHLGFIGFGCCFTTLLMEWASELSWYCKGTWFFILSFSHIFLYAMNEWAYELFWVWLLLQCFAECRGSGW